jgi:hypothetical protein
MPVPLLAAAMVPELTKAVSAMGAAKDVCLLDYVYQPTIKKPGTRTRDHQQIPNPNYPSGIRIQIPAWLMIVALIIGVPMAVLIRMEMLGQLGPLKESLGLKGKKGLFGWGVGGL